MNYFALEVTFANGCLKPPIFHLQTSHKYTCSHPGHVSDSNYTSQLSANDHLPRLRKIFTIVRMVALQGKRTVFSVHSCKEGEKWLTLCQPKFSPFR